MVRDNFAISIKQIEGEDRGVVISTHKNLNPITTKNSLLVSMQITFKAEA